MLDANSQNKKIFSNVLNIKYIIMVLSGKGGVGKSTFSVNLSSALSKNNKVGVLDIDIHGANIPKMMGLENAIFEKDENDLIYPVVVNENLKVASIGLTGLDSKDAIIWRSPVKTGVIRQFLSEVIWGDLDYLIIDTPAGTGDEALTIVQNIPISGSVVVSSPQEVSILDAQKSISFSRALSIPIIGIVENMSGFICPKCNTITELYKKGSVEKIAKEFEIDFLGFVPMDIQVMNMCDQGKPYMLHANEEDLTYKAYDGIKNKITDEIKKNEELGIYEKMRRDIKDKLDIINKKGDYGDFRPVR